MILLHSRVAELPTLHPESCSRISQPPRRARHSVNPSTTAPAAPVGKHATYRISNTRCAGSDFTNAVVDRVAFDKADLSNTNFTNAVITGTTFVGTNLDGASFEDALIGNEDVKRL